MKNPRMYFLDSSGIQMELDKVFLDKVFFENSFNKPFKRSYTINPIYEPKTLWWEVLNICLALDLMALIYNLIKLIK